MKNEQLPLSESNGTLYYEGIKVKAGDIIRIRGIVWDVLGGGRTPGKNHAAFLWVRNAKFGTAIYSPQLDENSPLQSRRPAENEFKPKIMYMNILII